MQVGSSPWGHKELGMTERLTHTPKFQGHTAWQPLLSIQGDPENIRTLLASTDLPHVPELLHCSGRG